MNSDKSGYGILYIVATPIGNLEDITLRALNVLKSSDIIAAEDTRRTIKLLNHFEIKKRLISYHEYSSDEKERELTGYLKAGLNIALVSDAGTPLISDPGYRLVKICIEEGIAVESVPGPCAAIAAATLSGMNLKQFIFGGFLETKSSSRKKELKRLCECCLPVILYESPNRVLKTLGDALEIWGPDAEICAARELTKIHEEVLRGRLCEVISTLSQRSEIKGEFVIIIAAREKENQTGTEDIIAALKSELAKGSSKKEAARIISEKTGVSKNEIYKLSLHISNSK